ncbi:MAG: hypothetical protein BWY41_00126 [Candidatus Atribacteria bacterium ADurb.Bin276]|uniref:Uncharacterized protein n=1 Tax=Candidatus Atribacter allofermentans TaxID=1852833 RepID=A0A1V5T3W2_9BACT|nr:MAG: hypothetical protein BWY41_00126 [Candidatus Atribacteria bacterium ADurb.Bin276]
MPPIAELEFESGMQNLSKFFRKKPLEPAQVAIWHEKLKWLDLQDFQTALDEITTCERTFPTPQVVLDYADEVRKRRSETQKRIDNNTARDFLRPEAHKPGIARDSAQFVNTLMNMPPGTVEKFEFEVSALKVLMKKYPNAEFNIHYQDAVKRLNAKLAELGKTNVMPLEAEKEERETN